RGRGQREIPQDFSSEAIERATDAALKRLRTDRIDLLQLHNIRMEQVYDDGLWKTLENLKSSGKIRYSGIALGPAIGWLYERMNWRARRHQPPAHLQPARATSRRRAARCRDRSRQGHDVFDSGNALVRNVGRQIHRGHGFSAKRSSQPSAAQLAA